MIDFLGQGLAIGDNVVAVSHKKTSSTLYLGEIIRTTPTMLVLKTIVRDGKCPDWRYGAIMYVSAYKTVKVDLSGICQSARDAQEGVNHETD